MRGCRRRWTGSSPSWQPCAPCACAPGPGCTVSVPRLLRVGYRLAARELGLEPCLRLGMRLGEGSGCPLLFQVLQAACAVMNGMATFPEAAIEDDYLAPIRQGDAFTVDKP